MSKIRLDDMSLYDVKELYNKMFKSLIDKEQLEKIYEEYKIKYDEMKDAESKGYQAPSGMGRRYNYLKNILYGWYIEDLFYILISTNPNVKSIEMTGNDSEHLFIYDHKAKKVSISGAKTTNPDYLITMHNGDKVYLELKTAAAEVYSIKIGNVKQLQKTMGLTDIYSMIIMIDLVNGLYEIKDMDYFINSFPFVNQRMEGQLCYYFPTPTKPFIEIKNENFSKYINNNLFNNDEVKKFKCLAIAEKNKDKSAIKMIKNKITLDEITTKFKFQEDEFKKKIDGIISKSPDIKIKSWDDILNEINN